MSVTGGMEQVPISVSGFGAIQEGMDISQFETSMIPMPSTGRRIRVNVLGKLFLVSIKLSSSMRMRVVVVVVAALNSSNDRRPTSIGPLRTPGPSSSASIHPHRGQLHVNRPPPITPSSQRSQSSPIHSKNVNSNPIPYRREGFPWNEAEEN